MRSACSSNGSKSTSQIQETSRPSAIASLSATTSVGGTPPLSSVRIASFAPAGFLISSMSTRRPSTSMRSKRPKAARNAASPSTISSSAVPRARQRLRRRERVVDVVEPRQRQPQPVLLRARDEVEARRLEPVQLDPARRHVELRAGVPARWAAVVAEMPDVGGGVGVRRAATQAVLRVGGVLQRRARYARVVDAVPDGAGRPAARSATSGSSATTTSAVSSGSSATASCHRSAMCSSSP